MGLDWKEIFGYFVSLFVWLVGFLPKTCEGWTHLLAFFIAFVTFFFITLPKAWDYQKNRRQEKNKVKK